MRVVVAGAHGKVARRLGRLLSARGDTVVGIVRNPDHRSDLADDGVEAAVPDLETVSPDDAAERAGVRTYLLGSSMGVGLVRDGAGPEGVDEVSTAYLRARLAAEEAVLGRAG